MTIWTENRGILRPPFCLRQPSLRSTGKAFIAEAAELRREVAEKNQEIPSRCDVGNDKDATVKVRFVAWVCCREGRR